MSKYYYSFRDNADFYSIHLSSQVIIVWLKFLTVFLVIFFWQQIYIFIYNSFIYTNKKFTEDRDLIEFINNIQPNFQNAYSLIYTKRDRLPEREEIQSEIQTINYEYLIDKDTLIEKIKQLFNQYQQDIVNKKFKAIREYTLEPFSFQQNNFDIIYDVDLSKIIPIQFEMREELKRFLVQINGEAINFKISQKGYVISGQSTARAFTEYWDIALDANNKCYLVNIY